MRMNKLFFCVLFSGMLSFCGCDAVYRLLQKEGAQEKDLVGEIVPFERNARIAEVQELLKLYGYSVGKADGVMGANTRNALEKFQTDLGLTPSRFVDYQTWDMLHIFEGYGLVIETKVILSAVQQGLQNAGLDPGPIDGRPGKRTLLAIKAFQSAHGLKADGKVGFRTLWFLADYLPFQE